MELDKIYNMDAFDGMKQLPDASVDMVLTDPPYGTTCNKWDTPIDLETFWREIKRVIKPRAATLLFSQMPFSAYAVMSNPKMFRYEWICEKANATGFLNARRMPMKCHENVLVFYDKLPVYNPQMIDGEPYTRGQSGYSSNYGRYFHEKKRNYSGKRFPRDVLRASWRSAYGKTLHPTQKPVSLCEYFIETYSNAGGLILDPFMGSATTAIAAMHEGRHFIGFENNAEYFDKAEKRIKEERAAAPSALPLDHSRQSQGRWQAQGNAGSEG